METGEPNLILARLSILRVLPPGDIADGSEIGHQFKFASWTLLILDPLTPHWVSVSADASRVPDQLLIRSAPGATAGHGIKIEFPNTV